MKKLIAIVISAVLCLSVAACGNAGGVNKDAGETTDSSASQQEQTAVSDPLELLSAVWSSYADADKFSVIGGDTSEANSTNDAPGKYDITDSAALDSTLGFPTASVGKIDSAASLMHMMNANTFTCGAYHAKEASDVSELAVSIKDNILQRRWMCGFPDKLVVVTLDSLIVSFFGTEDIVNTFKTNLTSAYPSAQVFADEPIV